jgi:hypothetical protein
MGTCLWTSPCADKFAHHTEVALSAARAEEKEFLSNIFHLRKLVLSVKTLSPYLVHNRQIRCKICYLSQLYVALQFNTYGAAHAKKHVFVSA